MKVKITSKTGNISLDEYQLFQFLLGKVIESNALVENTSNALSRALCEYLSIERKFSILSLEKLIKLSMNIGFYFKMFLEKNNVEISYNDIKEKDNDDLSEKSPSTPNN